MSNDTKNALLSDLSEKQFIQFINSSREPNGNLRIDIDGVDSFVTYATTEVFNWKLISITPYEYIVRDIEKMKVKTYYLGFFFILGSIVLSFYFSRRLYIPVRLIIQNYNILESEKRNEFCYKKQDFLRKMVLSDDISWEEVRKRQFKKYNISLEPFDKFLLVLIKIDHFSEFCNRFNLFDRGLLKYGIMNIISELLSRAYLYECIDIEEDQILILLKYDSLQTPSKDDRLLSLMKEVQLSTKQYLKFSLSATFSEPFETLHELNIHYLKTLDLSYYRLIYGHSSFIFNENLQILTDDYIYPLDVDKKMFEALINGQIVEAKKALSDVNRNASQYSFTIINSAIIRLLLTIRHAIEVIETHHSIKVNFNLNIYLSKLQKIETLEQIESDLFQLFESLSNELKSKKENKYSKLLEDVNHIILKEFANPGLSLEAISQKVNLSPAYLGRLFNKYRFISITDYINNVRITKAHEMLIASEDSINIIMEKSGFISRSHFFTLFKKKYGMTPNQVRSNAKLEMTNNLEAKYN